jgi:hypothetical protein
MSGSASQATIVDNDTNDFLVYDISAVGNDSCAVKVVKYTRQAKQLSNFQGKDFETINPKVVTF